MKIDTDRQESIINLRNGTIKFERSGDYWSDDEREKLKKMFYEGEGITAIAIELQRSEIAIVQQVVKLDLYNRYENSQRRKKEKIQHSCLCSICKADKSLCPLCSHFGECNAVKKDMIN